MRKYIFTNAGGQTAQGQQLAPGKFIHRDQKTRDVLSRITACCGDTPLLAIMLSPFSSASGKMFQINCWNISVDPKHADSYTVIKEVNSSLQVTLEDKMHFALTAIRRNYRNDDFSQWSEGWISGMDRTRAAAEAMLARLRTEQKANDELGELTAWGETGSDDTALVHKMDEQMHSIVHVLHAAVQMADGTPEEQVGRELAAALGDPSLLGGREALAALADQLYISQHHPGQAVGNG
jgi:hypothetical protein